MNHRTITKGDKTYYKAPRIQRLVTDKRVRRKKVQKKTKLERAKASAEAAAKYEKVLSKFVKERKASRAATKATEDAAKADTKAADGKAAKKWACKAPPIWLPHSVLAFTWLYSNTTNKE